MSSVYRSVNSASRRLERAVPADKTRLTLLLSERSGKFKSQESAICSELFRKLISAHAGSPFGERFLGISMRSRVFRRVIVKILANSEKKKNSQMATREREAINQAAIIETKQAISMSQRYALCVAFSFFLFSPFFFFRSSTSTHRAAVKRFESRDFPTRVWQLCCWLLHENKFTTSKRRMTGRWDGRKNKDNNYALSVINFVFANNSVSRGEGIPSRDSHVSDILSDAIYFILSCSRLIRR